MSRTTYDTSSLLELECYSKSNEELEALKTVFEQEMNTHKQERMKHAVELLKINRAKKITKDKLKLVTSELKRREDNEDAMHVFDACREELDGFTLLSTTELTIISTNMCREDYRQHGCPRWIDVTSICKTVIHMKQKYPTWKLVNMFIVGKSGTTPPRTFYKYEYVDDDDCHFDVGGLTIV